MSQIAALIPCFNDEYVIPLAVASIAPHVDEILVFDDGSDSETKQVLGRIAGKTANMRIIRGGNNQATWCGARVELMKHTGAEWLLFMDSDDILCDAGADELTRMRASRQSWIQLGLLELWGDFRCGTGRGVG